MRIKTIVVAAAALFAALSSQATEAWFSVDFGDPDLTWPSDAWSNTDNASIDNGVLKLDSADELTYAAGEKELDSAKIATVTTEMKFTAYEEVPAVLDDSKAGVIVMETGSGLAYYGLAKDGSANTNTWVQLTGATPTEDEAVVVNMLLKGNKVQYKIGETVLTSNSESWLEVVSNGTVSEMVYCGTGEISSLGGQIDNAPVEVALAWPTGCSASYKVNGGESFDLSGTSFTIQNLTAGDVVTFTFQNADGATKTLTATAGTDDEIDASDATFAWADYLGEAVNGAYTIDDANDLDMLRKGVASKLLTANVTFKQTANIDMSTAGAFAGIGTYNANPTSGTPFSGTYDGGNFKICNVDFTQRNYGGVFNQVNGGTIKNLTVSNITCSAFSASVNDGEWGGAIVGNAGNGATLQNLVAEGTFAADHPATHNVAGIVIRACGGGENGTLIKDCTNNATLYGAYTKIGGICAITQYKISGGAVTFDGCVNNGDIISSRTAATGVTGYAGILGYVDDDTVLVNCSNTGSIVNNSGANTDKDGALVGWAYTKDANGVRSLTDQGGNSAAKTDKMLAFVSDLADVTGFLYATVANDVATTVTSLSAGNTYLLEGNAAPVIVLDDDDTIAFDTALGYTLNDTGITAAEGLEVTSATVGTVTTYATAEAAVTITVPTVANTTVTATADGEPVEIVEGEITVASGAAVVLTYTSTTHEVTGGTIEFTAADGYTVDVSGITTTAYVATFNGTQYTSLAAAVPAWAASDMVTAYMNPIVLTADVTEDVTIPVNINMSAVPLQMQGSATINGTVTISEGATFQPLATVLFGGDVVVSGTLVRAGVDTLTIGGDLTLADGATLGATTLDSVNPVYAVAGDVEVEGVLNISLTSQTLEAGTYKVVTGTSVARDAEADVVVFLNDVENDNWVLNSTDTELTITGAAATVDDEKFSSFANAVTAAGGVKTITLLASASWTLTAGETLVVQAGGYTMTVTPPAGYALVETPVSEGVIAYTTQQYVAKLKNPNVGTTTYANEVYYTSLKAALADVVEQTMAVYANYKAVVTLLADDHVSFGAVTVEDGVPSGGSIVIDKAVVINGAGYTVYGNTNADILNATGSATPGKDMVADLVDGSNLLGFFVKSGNVTFNNITLTEFGDTAYVNKFGYTPIQTASAYAGTLTLTNVNFSKFNRTAVCVRGGTLSMTGGTVSGGTVNKNNGDYFQQPLEVRGGTATINGVTITGGDDVAGNGGGAIVAWSDITVTNVVVNFTGIGIWSDGGTVTVTGDNTAVTATGKALFAEEGYAIVVSAGTFNGAIAKDGNANSSISITGGTFSVDPSAYVADGYKAVESAGVWTVGVDAGGFPGGEDGKTFTINDTVQAALEAKLDGKKLTDTVAGTTSGLTYAQAYALGLFDEDTETVEDIKPTIEIVDGKVVVSLDGTDVDDTKYTVTLTVYETASIATPDWKVKATYELDSAEEAVGFTPTTPGSGFYKVGVTIEDAE